MNSLQNDPNYNCEVTLEDGSKYRIFADWLWNNEANYFKGWACNAGHTRFHIDKNFEVWSGICLNDHLGNALTEWSIKTDVVCQQDRCSHCTSDLQIKKTKLT